MSWQNPWACFGLLFLAAPIVLHMLGRHTPRVQPFPTLRFLTSTRLLPTRRTRVSDWLVLAARLLIVLLAVGALAQPLLLTRDRARGAHSRLARAIVLDTSASMLRTSTSGDRALVVARREVSALAKEAQTSVVIESASPANALSGAIAWLNTQPSRAELVVVSDFQIGALDSIDLAIIPSSIGIRLRQIPTSVGDSVFTSSTVQGLSTLLTRTTITSEHTSVDWRLTTTSDSAHSALSKHVQILAAANDSGAIGIVRRAALTLGATAPPTANDVIALVYPAHPARRALLQGARALRTPWMTNVIAQLLADSLLVATLSDVITTDSVTAATTALTVILRNAEGGAVLLAACDSVDGINRLLLFTQFELGSVTSPALLHAIDHALSRATPLREYEPANVTAHSLRAWERPPTNVQERVVAHAQTASPLESDGRWVWLAVLTVLGVESWLRRSREPSRDRIA